MTSLIQLDGSQGEGGGQILRSALALSLATGQGFRIERIRANRTPPGLRPQHLQAVRAAREICDGETDGDREGSRSLRFVPGAAKAGEYSFPIRTAGCASLVLQTVHLPLALLNEPSRVRITGGTHVPFAPCFDYLVEAWQPALRPLGFMVDLESKACGFYPAGGGELIAQIHPRRQIDRFEWLARGELHEITPISMACRLPTSVALRQAVRAIERLEQAGLNDSLRDPLIEQRPAGGPGTMLGLRCIFTHSQSFFYALGAKGKPAETVADEACDELIEFLQAGDQPVDPHLADQLLVPLAAGRIAARYSVSKVTQHLLTNADVIARFTDWPIRIDGELGEAAVVHTGKHLTEK